MILKKLFLFELEVATLSFIGPLLFGYENVTKLSRPFFGAAVGTSCGPTWYMVIFGLAIGLIGFAFYYFLFDQLLKIPQRYLMMIFQVIAVLSALGSSMYVLCGL